MLTQLANATLLLADCRWRPRSDRVSSRAAGSHGVKSPPRRPCVVIIRLYIYFTFSLRCTHSYSDSALDPAKGAPPMSEPLCGLAASSRRSLRRRQRRPHAADAALAGACWGPTLSPLALPIGTLYDPTSSS